MQRAISIFFPLAVLSLGLLAFPEATVAPPAFAQGEPPVSGDPREAKRLQGNDPAGVRSFGDAQPAAPAAEPPPPTPAPSAIPTSAPAARASDPTGAGGTLPSPTKTPLRPLTVLTPPPLPQGAPKPVTQAADLCNEDIVTRCTGLGWGSGLASCLKENAPELKPKCRKQVQRLEKRHEKFQATRDTCRHDVNRFCNDVQPGGGRVLACLKNHEMRVTRTCQAKLKGLATPPSG